jgi:hypothetical protein
VLKIFLLLIFFLPKALADSPAQQRNSKQICEEEEKNLTTLLKSVHCSWAASDINPSGKKDSSNTCKGDLKCEDPNDALPDFSVRYDLVPYAPSCPASTSSCGEIDQQCRESILVDEKNVCNNLDMKDPHHYSPDDSQEQPRERRWWVPQTQQ